MIKAGSTMLKIERVVYLPNDEEDYKTVEVDVLWNYESCTYGDDSEDVEFNTYATDEDGNQVELSPEEEQKLLEELRNAGELS